MLYGSNIWYFGEGMLGPLFAVFAERVGGDILDISWAWAIYLIVTGIFVIIIGRLSDHEKNYAKLMVLGYALNTIFTFSYIFVSSTTGLFFVQVGLGVSLALASPTWSALYAKYEDKRHAGYLWGLASGEAQILTGIAITIGGFIVTYYSFTTLFLIMGFVQIIATIYQSQILFSDSKH